MRKRLLYLFQTANSTEELLATLEDYKEKGIKTIDTINFNFIDIDYVIERIKSLSTEHYTLEEIYMQIMNVHLG